MIIKKKKIIKRKLKIGYNHGYGKLPNFNGTLVYFGISLLLFSFGLSIYYLEFTDIPLADRAEYVKERIIVGQPSGFNVPDIELKN